MNKFKIMIGILFSIFLVGCEATYEVDIDDNVVTENFNFIEKDTSKYNSSMFSHTDITYQNMVNENATWPTGAFYQKDGNQYEPIKMEGVEYYNQTLINDEGLGIKYDYTFNLDNYNESNAVRSCFKNFAFVNGEEKITIYANNASYCFNGRKMLDKVTIKLTTSYPAISHNEDKYDKNTKTYIWNIKAANASNKTIKMELSKDLKYKPKEEKNIIEKESSSSVILIIFGIFAFIAGIIVLIVYRKNKKVNNI